MCKINLTPPDYNKMFSNVWGPNKIWNKRVRLDRELAKQVSKKEALQIWGHLIYNAACEQVIRSRLEKPHLHYSEHAIWCRKCGHDMTGGYEGRGIYKLGCPNKKCNEGSYRISRETGRTL